MVRIHNPLRQLSGIRRQCLTLLDSPKFAENEVSLDEHDKALFPAAGDPFCGTDYISVRGRHSQRRCFRKPSVGAHPFVWMELILGCIDIAWSLYRQIHKSHEYLPKQIDELTEKCIWIGSYAAALGIDLKKRTDSRPKKTREKLTDPAESSRAEDEIKRLLRGTNRSFTNVCAEASINLRAHEIEVSGKVLSQKFSHLKPKATEK